MKIFTRLVIAIALLFSFSIISRCDTAYALQGVSTQTVNINVLPDIPDTGAEPTISSESDQSQLPSSLIYISLSIFMLGVIGIAILRKKTRLRSYDICKRTFISIAILGLCSALSLIVLRQSSAVTNPTIDLSPAAMSFNLKPGESAQLDFEITVTTGIDSIGHELFTISDNTSADIALSISGGDLVGEQPLPDSWGAPLLIRSLATNAVSGDISNYTLSVAVGASIPVGNYTVAIEYAVETEEAPDYNGEEITSVDPATCRFSVAIGTIFTVHDSRGDGQDYRIRCMEDGRYWMINNLKLGSLTEPLALTPADTNISSNWSLPIITTASSGFVLGSENSPQVGANTTVAGAGSLQTDITSANFYGYYYNWCAATAGGTASGGSNTCTVGATMPASATGDICPSGWRLPTGTRDGEYATLNGSMEAGYPDAPTQSNYYWNWQPGGRFGTVFAGISYGGATWPATPTNSRLWTSTSSSVYDESSVYAFDAQFTTTLAAPSSLANRYGALSVRCIAD